MKTFKKILRALVLLHIFPLIIMGIVPEHSNLEGYLLGWGVNIVVGGIGLIILSLSWIFSNDDDDNNYDYYP